MVDVVGLGRGERRAYIMYGSRVGCSYLPRVKNLDHDHTRLRAGTGVGTPPPLSQRDRPSSKTSNQHGLKVPKL